jgi:RNA-directed DNA polymerase
MSRAFVARPAPPEREIKNRANSLAAQPSVTAGPVRRIRHLRIPDQAGDLNAVLRGHYAYYGIAGNIRALQKVYRAVERYWRKILCSRSWAGRHLTWEVFAQIKERTPLLRPKLYLPYRELQALAVL